MKKISLLVLLTIFTIQLTQAQKIKFGKVSKEALEEKLYPLDSSANAAYLYKKRNTYTTVLAGSIELTTVVHGRIKIYNKEGFDWATKEIQLYKTSHSNRERVIGLKAVTYNLQDGEIVKTKLEKSEVF